jgi:hypothetical protein
MKHYERRRGFSFLREKLLTAFLMEFYFKIKHYTKLNKITFMKNKNLTYNHPVDEKIYKNYSFIRNKELIK